MFDLLIKSATVVDGTGAKSWVGDVAIEQGRFVALDHRIEAEARRVIPAGGYVLAPGFIDIHCHSDSALFDHPRSENKLKQGVTLDVLGNCGDSLAPLEGVARASIMAASDSDIASWNHPLDWSAYGEYVRTIEETGLSINVMGLVGHGTLRLAAMGQSDAPPTTEQMDRMKSLLARSLDEGAAGMSTGLIYAPGCFSDTRELIELAKVVGRRGGFYASHIRNEAEGIITALEEVIRIGREGQVGVHVSHLKLAGIKNWHLWESVVKKLEKARADGIDITCDVYPYFHSCTTMLALLPPWSLEGGLPSLIPRLKDPRQRRQMIAEIKDGLPGWENMYHNSGWRKIVVSSVQSSENKAVEGKSIAAIAAERQVDPFDLVFDLVEAENGVVSIISESMNEENMVRFITLPFAMIGSDGSPSRGRPHPRLYGTFPRVFRRIVRELGALSIEAAVHKMSGQTARRLGLQEAGIIRRGLKADAVIFDPLTFGDTATYDHPQSFPRGLLATIVNGEVVIDGEKHTGVKSGRFYRS
ncbi:MAG: D-aminoacylase [Deltaproteobacteria bacterium]|nr:D-aminoacylase [Deltaproteobacteria bacterium]